MDGIRHGARSMGHAGDPAERERQSRAAGGHAEGNRQSAVGKV